MELANQLHISLGLIMVSSILLSFIGRQHNSFSLIFRAHLPKFVTVCSLTRLVRFCFLLGLLAFCTVTLADDCPPKDRGWFIKVCPGETKARGMAIYLGPGQEGNLDFWREWKHGEATEFPLPLQYRHAGYVHIGGKSLEDDENAYFCLAFNDHVVKHLDFDSGKDIEEHKVERDYHDEDCDCW
jgi:hypothetical protein